MATVGARPRGRTRRGRGLRWTAAALGAALVAAACSASDDTGGDGDGGEVDPEGVISIGYDLENQVTSLDPAVSNNTCDKNVWTYLLDSLLRVDAESNLQPGLAEAWEIGDDGSSVTLTLREGLTYHDGSALTADTVRQGIERNNENENLSALDNIESMEAVDDTTLRIELAEPRPLELLYDFTGQSGMLIAPSGFDTAESAPIGAGPFAFESYEPGRTLRMMRFDDHWEADEYQLGGIEYTQVGVGPPAVAALQSGSLDLIRFFAESRPTVEGISNADFSSTTTNEYLQLEFRKRNSLTEEETPFADVLVRRAVSHAVNREQVNANVEAGEGIPAWQPYPPGSPYHVEDLDEAYPYDPARARELLAEAGYPDGFEFDMAIPGGGIANMEALAELVQSDLAEVGITANINRILPQDIANEYYLAKQGDAFSAAELPQVFPPDVVFNQFGEFQFVAIHDGAEREDITALADEAFVATDSEELAGITQDMVRIQVEEALDVPIAHTSKFAGWNTDTVGGTPGAPPDACRPFDLRGVFAKQ